MPGRYLMVFTVSAIFNCDIYLIISNLIVFFKPSDIMIFLFINHLLDLFLDLVLGLISFQTIGSIVSDDP